MENLQPYDAHRLWFRVNNAQNQSLDFTEFEIKVLDLLVNYCCYAKKHRIPRSKDFISMKTPKDYYSKMSEYIQTGCKLRVGKIKLSSLTKDQQMSKLVSRMEDK